MCAVDAFRPHNTAARRRITTRQQLFGWNTKCQAVVGDSDVEIERLTEISSRNVQPPKLKQHTRRRQGQMYYVLQKLDNFDFYDDSGTEQSSYQHHGINLFAIFQETT